MNCLPNHLRALISNLLHLKLIKKSSLYIVVVPTPAEDYNLFNLVPVTKATETVARVLKKGD
jgi:UDP-N-acetyl-D-mannosaminuronate dehydrogenase